MVRLAECLKTRRKAFGMTRSDFGMDINLFFKIEKDCGCSLNNFVKYLTIIKMRLKIIDESDGVNFVIKSVNDMRRVISTIVEMNHISKSKLSQQVRLSVFALNKVLDGDKDMMFFYYVSCIEAFGFRLTLEENGDSSDINKFAVRTKPTMTRGEFCKLLTQINNESGLSESMICFYGAINQSSYTRMINGLSNFSINNMFKYLRAVGYMIVLSSSRYSETYSLYSIDDFSFAFKNMRLTCNFSMKEAANIIGVNAITVSHLESGKTNMRVDSFLQGIYGFGYELKLIKKEVTNNGSTV